MKIKQLTQNWKEVKLSEIIECIESGSRPKGGIVDISEGIPSIGGEHVNKDGGFDFTNLRLISEEFYNLQNRGKIKLGDVLVVKDGATTGKVSLVTKENFPYNKALVNEHVFILRPKQKEVTPEFLFFYLFGIEGQRQILSNFHGSAQGGINTQFVNNVFIYLPPLQVQSKIVTLVEKAKGLKEYREEADKLSNAYLQNVYFDLFGNPTKNNKGWKTKKVEEICSLVRGSSPRPKGDPRYYGGDVPRLMISDITRDGRKVTPKVDFLTNDGAKLSRPIKKGTIVMTVSGDVGVTAILNVDACIHDGFVAFNNLKEKEIEKDFFEFTLKLLKSTHVTRKVGAIFQNLTTDQIKNIEIPLPPLELQNKFAKIVEHIEKLKEKQKKSKEEINLMFDSLMKQAFNGELTK